jgi:hypothetical protein
MSEGLGHSPESGPASAEQVEAAELRKVCDSLLANVEADESSGVPLYEREFSPDVNHKVTIHRQNLLGGRTGYTISETEYGVSQPTTKDQKPRSFWITKNLVLNLDGRAYSYLESSEDEQLGLLPSEPKYSSDPDKRALQETEFERKNQAWEEDRADSYDEGRTLASETGAEKVSKEELQGYVARLTQFDNQATR